MKFKHNCRGLQTKQEMVRNYTLRILNRWKVLNRKIPLEGCCGVLEDEAYTFEYEDKANSGISGTFHVGYHCAEQFLDLLKLPKPPLVDLLGPTETEIEKTKNLSRSGNQPGPFSVHPLNREVELAAVIILQAWGSDPKEPLREILKAVRSRPLDPIPDWRVKSLIKVISFDRQGRTLAQMAEDLRKDNPGMRRLSFLELLRSVNRLKLNNLIQ